MAIIHRPEYANKNMAKIAIPNWRDGLLDVHIILENMWALVKWILYQYHDRVDTNWII